MDSAAARKRKDSSKESEASKSSILMASKTRRRLVDSTASDRVSSSSSCCLSSDDDELASSSKSADLEQRENENGFTVAFTATSPCDSSDCSERRETSEVDGGEVEPRLGRVGKMPSEAELEEFFAAAAKSIQKKFIDKYNFDIVKDEPLEGRYEWVSTK